MRSLIIIKSAQQTAVDYVWSLQPALTEFVPNAQLDPRPQRPKREMQHKMYRIALSRGYI